MIHSSREVFLHFVWSTKYREPTITTHIQREMYRVLRAEAKRLGCTVLALNGTEDHIHLLVQLGPDVPLARFANRLKGVSAWFVNQKWPGSENEAVFRWQVGYGVSSVGLNQINRVITYIDRQREHHATNDIHAKWEPEPDTQSAPCATPPSPGRMAEGR